MSESNPFTTWLHRGKDASTSLLARRALDQALNRYGRMLDFKIDSRQKTIGLEILPKGESTPITVTLQHYEVVAEPGGTFITVQKAAASREWLAVLLNDFVCGRRFPVPEKYGALLRLLT